MTVCAVALVAVAASAQDATPAEFGRASGGALELMAKRPSRLSGSLGLTLSGSAGATLGGTLIPDRLWFFGTAEHTRTAQRMLDARAISQLGDRQSLNASLAAAARQPAITSSTPLVTLPSSFLSLHYTAIVSSNSFFDISVSQRRSTLAP